MTCPACSLPPPDRMGPHPTERALYNTMRKIAPHIAARFHLAVIVAVTISATATIARADDWASAGLDAGRTRLSAERSGATFADGRWSVQGAGAVLASPVVADGFAVIADLNGSVRAVRADDGQLVWQVPLDSSIRGTPAISAGRVFAPTVGNEVVAMRLVDGQRLWSRDVGGMVMSSPAMVDKDLVLAAGFPSQRLVRVSGTTGEIIWQSPPVMEQFSNSSPAVGSGLAVVGSQGGRIYAFNVATGESLWTYAGDGIVNMAAPLIAGGRVYLAGGDKSNRVHAVDAATGKAVTGWPVELPAPDPDVAGTLRGRQRAVSSIASAAGLLLLQTRLDDALDVNADGTLDRILSRESVVALDATSGAVAWQYAIGRAELTDPNGVPKFFVCPTPAAYASGGGQPLIAAASSLSPTIVVLDPARGVELGRIASAGPALASPVIANGRLVSAAMNGTVEGIASSVNHAPSAAILYGYARPLDAADVTLRWLAATDRDAELPSYDIRIDSDGEVLESWQYQLTADAGVTSVTVNVPLSVGTTYSYAVRARDAHGALSAWSLPETFSVTVNPTVTVGGMPAGSLRAAAEAAQPGDTLMLGAGTYTLTQTVNVAAGVAMRGAGAGRTTIDATRLSVGINFDRSTPERGSRLEDLTIAGAETCVQIADGATGVQVRHVIVRDCRVKGISVRAGGGADIANATLIASATAVQTSGTVRIKNSLLTENVSALVVESPGTLASRYNNLFANQKDYSGTEAGEGDLAQVVTFTDLKTRDLHLAGPQPTTDKGDPSDKIGDEPEPNGGRLNLGAFGGTAEAELTAPSTAVGGSSPAGPALVADTPATATPSLGSKSPASPGSNADEQVGCSVVPGGQTGGLMAALASLSALFVRRRRRASRGEGAPRS